jgi:hypothetical protein
MTHGGHPAVAQDSGGGFLMKRVLVVAAAAATMVVCSSPAAFAGEVRGSGGATPAGDMARSACAFSGLEDYPLQPGTTQNWGQIVRGVPGHLGGANSTMTPFGEEGCNAHMYPNK